jgi:guanine deaminase
MTTASPTLLVRAQICHTPRDPFTTDNALVSYEDGGLAIQDRRVLHAGDWPLVRAEHPDAAILDARDALLIPGLVDTHVHFPQVAVIGTMGLQLLEWLQRKTLPHEARLANPLCAERTADTFLRLLASNGTTTALVFGSHFTGAQNALFRAAERWRLRITSGLVVSDVSLRDELHTEPERAREQSLELAARWHGRGHLRYAVTPRFSLSCTEAMLDACGHALATIEDGWFTTHINENVDEIDVVRAAFPGFRDYLDTYERFGLIGARSVLAHNVHPEDRELERIAAAFASIAHCPSSNAFVGSGLFPLRRHVEHGIRIGLGSDVGGGTGFSMLKEAAHAYQTQMLHPAGYPLSPAHALHLATRAGALTLGLEHEIGDFQAGKAADFVLLRAPRGSTLESVLEEQTLVEDRLASFITLAREEAISDVFIDGIRLPVGQATETRASCGLRGSDALETSAE